MQYIIPTNAFGFFFFEVRLHIFSFYMLFTPSANRSDRLFSSLRETRGKRTPPNKQKEATQKIHEKKFSTPMWIKYIINSL